MAYKHCGMDNPKVKAKEHKTKSKRDLYNIRVERRICNSHSHSIRIYKVRKMRKEELIHLRTKESEYGTEIYLDDKKLHHIEKIEIKSSVVSGTAELLIKMKVRYP